MSKLLKAFGSNVDHGTIRFLLDTLACAETEDWEPILEPFVDDPSAVLRVLAASNTANIIIEEAKNVLDASCQEEEEGEEPPPPSNNPLYHTIKYTAIPGAHNRGISLRQLHQIIDYIHSHAEDGRLPWTDQDEQSPSHGQRLQVATINLYQVVDWVVKPLTQQHQCSMVEILATGPQPPRWVCTIVLLCNVILCFNTLHILPYSNVCLTTPLPATVCLSCLGRARGRVCRRRSPTCKRPGTGRGYILLGVWVRQQSASHYSRYLPQ